VIPNDAKLLATTAFTSPPGTYLDGSSEVIRQRLDGSLGILPSRREAIAR
jgi:hypothetical protein